MAKSLLKQKAIELRRSGQSYSQIKKQLGVSKSTLSNWLQDMPLPPERIRELRDWNEVRIERYRETRRKSRESALRNIYESERSKIFPLSKREEFLCGLFLYWGEGSKRIEGSFSLSNTDYRMMRFFVHWTRDILEIPIGKIIVRLHLYSDMDVVTEQVFWSEALEIPLGHFKKPYLKKSNLAGLSYKNGFGHGTCNVIVNDAMLCKRILMGIRSIADALENQKGQ